MLSRKTREIAAEEAVQFKLVVRCPKCLIEADTLVPLIKVLNQQSFNYECDFCDEVSTIDLEKEAELFG